VLKRAPIYLDQNYWIYCRDAYLRRPANRLHSEIFRRLEHLVRSGQALCPLSSANIAETFKQSDQATRLATAEVMDELSAGVAMQSPQSRRAAEFQYAVHNVLNTKTPAENPIQTIWTSPGFVFGEAKASEDTADLRAVCKATVDMFYRMRFPDIVDAMVDLSRQVDLDDSSTIAKHNSILARNPRGSQTFLTLFAHEANAYLRALERELRGELRISLPARPDASQKSIDKAAGAIARAVKEAMADKLNRGQLTTKFPSLHISCCIYAGIVFKDRKFKRGDHYDHLHATAALPYCNVFLTERMLGTLLREKPLELDKSYSCRVCWEPEEALSVLWSIGN
jgi:hypothetical protein